MTTVIVDNYDSFSYNLYQAIGAIDPDVTVVRNDEVTVGELASMDADRIVLSPGPGRPEDAGICVEAVPAYNVEPERLGMHPRENGWLGYVVTLDGEPTRYYVSGDTDQNADNETVSCDVALVPIGGTYTCDPHQAAAFVNALRPHAVVPTHYGSIVGTYADFDAFAAAVDPAIDVIRKLER